MVSVDRDGRGDGDAVRLWVLVDRDGRGGSCRMRDAATVRLMPDAGRLAMRNRRRATDKPQRGDGWRGRCAARLMPSAAVGAVSWAGRSGRRLMPDAATVRLLVL